MACSLQTGFLSRNSRVRRDTVLGVVCPGMITARLVLSVSISTDARLDHILFGFVLGGATASTIILVLTALFVAALARRLSLTAANSRKVAPPGP